LNKYLLRLCSKLASVSADLTDSADCSMLLDHRPATEKAQSLNFVLVCGTIKSMLLKTWHIGSIRLLHSVNVTDYTPPPSSSTFPTGDNWSLCEASFTICPWTSRHQDIPRSRRGGRSTNEGIYLIFKCLLSRKHECHH